MAFGSGHRTDAVREQMRLHSAGFFATTAAASAEEGGGGRALRNLILTSCQEEEDNDGVYDDKDGDVACRRRR